MIIYRVRWLAICVSILFEINFSFLKRIPYIFSALLLLSCLWATVFSKDTFCWPTEAHISCVLVASWANPTAARYLMVGWTWTDIDGCVWTICIIHMFNMQNAAGTKTSTYLSGYARYVWSAYMYVREMKCLQVVRLLWNLQQTSIAVYK